MLSPSPPWMVLLHVVKDQCKSVAQCDLLWSGNLISMFDPLILHQTLHEERLLSIHTTMSLFLAPDQVDIDFLLQDSSISSALAMEIL